LSHDYSLHVVSYTLHADNSVIQTALAGTALDKSIEDLKQQCAGRFVFVGIDKVRANTYTLLTYTTKAIQFSLLQRQLQFNDAYVWLVEVCRTL
jgi:hypothetical protein